MKTIKSTLLIFGLLLIATSCNKQFGWIKGKGPTTTETRPVTGFNKIALDIDAEVQFVQDSVYYVEVSAQENILDVIRTEVSAGELKIDSKRHIRKSNPITVIVHAPSLHGLAVSGSGNIVVNSAVNTGWLTVEVSGSGNVSLPALQSQELNVTISGSGDVSILNGTVTNATLKISGSGNIEMLNLVTQQTAAKISGSGDISIHVNQQLKATISGSGNILYSGNAAVSASISGSGSVTHI